LKISGLEAEFKAAHLVALLVIAAHVASVSTSDRCTCRFKGVLKNNSSVEE